MAGRQSTPGLVTVRRRCNRAREPGGHILAGPERAGGPPGGDCADVGAHVGGGVGGRRNPEGTYSLDLSAPVGRQMMLELLQVRERILGLDPLVARGGVTQMESDKP
eukprot:9403749-Pyramimonas_sp.AAC.1